MTTAPDLELPDQDGATVRLSALWADGPVALFFFPEAFTTACTKEVQAFRDLGDEFAAARMARVGVSPDDPKQLRLFARTHGLGFPLLSDPDRTAAAAYGVKRGGLLGRALKVKRTTFVLARGGRIVGTYAEELAPERHAEEALRLLARA